MRIGIVVDDLNRRRGGMSEWCWQFIHAIARRGAEAYLIAQGFGEDGLPANVVQHQLPRTKSRLEFAAAAEQAAKGLALDIVHDMGIGWHFDIFQPHGGSYAAWMARRLDMYPAWFRAVKRPIDALLPRRRDYSRHWKRQCEAMKRSDTTIIALSNLVANDFVDLSSIPPSRIAVIHNGVDCNRFSPALRAEHRSVIRRQLGVDDGTLLLLLAAHNFRLKGVPELLRVAARLTENRRRAHVVIAGGKRLKRWQLAAARLKIGDSVTFLGTVADMAPLYAAADVYVHPTYYDPCSLVLLEAAASGLPIVTTRKRNGAVELFRENEILTVDNPSASDALYERIDALFDERLRRSLSSAARNVALRNTIERNVAQIAKLYENRVHRTIAA
ncbi:MAG TPA: glycosyltransferase family 4 protein [Lacipirellulaceae bacterium]|jgi:UDP-glucose:(heptosyl)LPS alpha-1,3-glucosyltransferase|nr:glycosyltransferase family 4 protein [Lacipirellulaceae bacterium]